MKDKNRIHACIAGIRTGNLSKSMQLCKTRNQAKFPTGTKNSNMHCACCVEIAILLMLLSTHVTSVLFLVQFNNFVLTMGFFWSYTLLLKSPVLMCSWHAYQWHSHVTRLDVGMSGNGSALCWAIQPTVLFTYTTQLM